MWMLYRGTYGSPDTCVICNARGIVWRDTATLARYRDDDDGHDHDDVEVGSASSAVVFCSRN